MIYLTSFKRAEELPANVERWSAAVYQPKGFNYPKAPWTDIRDTSGRWTRPREFIGHANPREAYRKALLDLYGSRYLEANAWLQGLEGDASLMCWCPVEKAAIRQLKEYGSFICHTSVIGEFLATEFGVPVWYDSDRLFMTVLTQHGTDRGLARVFNRNARTIQRIRKGILE